MTADGSENGGSTTDPGGIIERALSDIATADDADAVAAVAARAVGRLLDDHVDCLVLDADGDPVAAGASDGTDPSTRRDPVAVTDADDELTWPADPLSVAVPDTGWLVVWADTDATAPGWAVRSIASAAVDAAGTRTELAAADERIDELEAETEQLANFATIVAHDLRNPLAIAQGNLELARNHDDEAHFEKIADAHDRIQRIIDHTLSMAKDEADGVETERVEVGTVAHEAWETVETGAATLTVSDSLRLVANRDRLQQLFENLFRNAVEHGVSDQRIETNGGRESTVGRGLAVEVGTLSDETGFFVADNGPGIPEAERESVFDEGYSEGDGTGLGLSIIADIAAEHGWSATVTAGRDGGARFEFGDAE